ncbi:amino acid kinase family protein, partial [Escherichia sp. TWPC-MK]
MVSRVNATLTSDVVIKSTEILCRGGSDYTAALLAEALHASRVDIWTD